jgi:uncharacterized protein YabN with tetrapyrrole methylase and pyrophosphatase domain
MKKLIVVGSGIKTLSHLSEETKVVIQDVDKVLYLVTEPLLKKWIEDKAKDASSLEPYYYSTTKRVDAYARLTQKIIDTYHKDQTVCVVFYGHPTIFASAALSAVKTIRAEGGEAIILPAISALDCLFSDLAINPGEKGYYSVDATDLLVYDKKIDPYSHLIIWQAASLGCPGFGVTTKIKLLIDYLLTFYPPTHEVIIYEGSQYPRYKPRILRIAIEDLVIGMLTKKTTLFLQALSGRVCNQYYLKQLDMDIDSFSVTRDLDTTSK